MIAVNYKYENHSHNPIFGFDMGQRNFLLPAGKAVTPKEAYFLPTTHAIRQIDGYTLKGIEAPELEGKLKTALGANWHAFISRPKQSGLAVHHRDSWYTGWFVWKQKVEFPTYEWMYGDLAPGTSRETAFDLIQVDGFDALSFASPALLADMKLATSENNLTVTLKSQALTALPEGTKLVTTIRKVASTWQQEHTVKDFQSNRTLNLVYPLNGNGLYEVTQAISRGKQTLAKWGNAVALGKETAYEALFRPEFPENTEPQLINGWKAPDKDVLRHSKAAPSRGFFIAVPENGNQYTEVSSLDLRVARNEFESVELVIYPLMPGGDFSIQAAPPAGAELRVIPEKRERLDGRELGMTTRHARLLDDRATITGEKPTSVWVVVGGPNMRPGKYLIPVVFRNQQGQSATVNINLQVSSVALSSRNKVLLESEYGLPGVIIINNSLRRKWFQNMSEHGVDFYQHPLRGLPQRRLSEFDKIIDDALAAGLTCFKAARYDLSAPSEKEKQEWKFLGEFLRSKGYQDKDLFVKILDEQPATKFPAMAKTGKWLNELGFRAFSTSDMLFAHPEELKILSPYFHMYQGGYVGPLTIAKRIQDGLLKPGDLIGNYTGWGTCYQSYETMLDHGVATAVLGLPFFHNHEYMRGDNRRLAANIVKINDRNLPTDSAAHEGLRDGMEFACLAQQCREWLAILGGSNQELRQRFDQALETAAVKEPFQYEGQTDYRTRPAKYPNYLAAKNELLNILEALQELTRGQDHGIITWNDLQLRTPTAMFHATGPEADFFTAEFLRRFQLKAVSQNGIEIQFQLSGDITQSYRIIRQGNRVVVQAKTAENLHLAAQNWLNTMTATGVWQ